MRWQPGSSEVSTWPEVRSCGLLCSIEAIGPPRRLLLVVVHQLVIDPASWRILLEDLVALDEAGSRGELPVDSTGNGAYRRSGSGAGTRRSLETKAEDDDDAATGWLEEQVPRRAAARWISAGEPRPGNVLAEADTLTIELDEEESRGAACEEVPAGI